MVAVDQDQVALRFLGSRTPEWSLFWWLLAAFLAGAGLMGVALLPGRARTAWRIRRLESAKAKAGAERAGEQDGQASGQDL